MKLTTTVFWDEDDGTWVARIGDYPELKGIGETSFEALKDLALKIDREMKRTRKTKPAK
jgi:hypothetical protein